MPEMPEMTHVMNMAITHGHSIPSIGGSKYLFSNMQIACLLNINLKKIAYTFKTFKNIFTQ